MDDLMLQDDHILDDGINTPTNTEEGSFSLNEDGGDSENEIPNPMDLYNDSEWN
jgi:hypothetical protein